MTTEKNFPVFLKTRIEIITKLAFFLNSRELIVSSQMFKKEDYENMHENFSLKRED